MKTLQIVSNNYITKDIFLEGQMIDVLDFGTITKSSTLSKNMSISEMRFIRKEPSDTILEKYGIDYTTYNNVCNTLQKELKSYMF